MEDFDKYLDQLVENFFDTGKVGVVEDIEVNNENPNFGVGTEEEIVLDDELEDEVENVDDISEEEKVYIEKEYGWLKDKDKVKNILKTDTYKGKNIRKVDPFRAFYILTNEIKKGNSSFYLYVNFVEFLGKVNEILDTDMEIIYATYQRMTNRFIERTKEIYGLTDEQIKNWVEGKKRNKTGANGMERREEEKGKMWEESFKNLEEYLRKTDVSEITYKSTGSLLKGFKLPESYEDRMDSLIEVFGNDTKTLFYLKYITNKENSTMWTTFLKYSKGIKEIVSNNKIPDSEMEESRDSVRWYIKRLKSHFNKIKKEGYCYIFSDNCKLSDNEIEKVEEFLSELEEETYEKSFLDLGFEKPEDKGVESRIHNLGGVEYSFVEQIKDEGVTPKEITDFILSNIIEYMRTADDIVKYDIVTSKEFKLNDRTIIPKNSKIEVKDIDYTDSFLSEFLASPVKKTEYGIRTNPQYLERYNEVIGKLFTILNEKDNPTTKKIIELITHDLEGMILSNNIYVPNKDDNIDFYLSNISRYSGVKQLRIAVRYNINLKNKENFYKIGENGTITPLNNTEYEKLEKKDKEKQIYVPKDTLDNIIENFFDTGKFVI